MKAANDKWDGRFIATPIMKRVGTRPTSDGVEFGYQIDNGPFVVTSSIKCDAAGVASAVQIAGAL